MLRCCDAAVKSGDAGNSLGGVLCCDGRTVICTWKSSATGVTNLEAEPISKNCIREHEETHLDDIDCDAKSPLRPPFKKGKDQATKECEAYKVHVKCLEKGLASCKTQDGRDRLQKELDARKKQRVTWCNKAGIPIK